MFDNRQEAAAFLAAPNGIKAMTDPCIGGIWEDPAARVFIGSNPGEGWRKVESVTLPDKGE